MVDNVTIIPTIQTYLFWASHSKIIWQFPKQFKISIITTLIILWICKCFPEMWTCLFSWFSQAGVALPVAARRSQVLFKFVPFPVTWPRYKDWSGRAVLGSATAACGLISLCISSSMSGVLLRARFYIGLSKGAPKPTYSFKYVISNKKFWVMSS